MNEDDGKRLRQHLHRAIDELEQIALNFFTAGRGIERVLAIDLAPARDIVDRLLEEEA